MTGMQSQVIKGQGGVEREVIAQADAQRAGGRSGWSLTLPGQRIGDEGVLAISAALQNLGDFAHVSQQSSGIT